MTLAPNPHFADVPPGVLSNLRSIAGRLPEAGEEPAGPGIRWRIRNRTFAHLLALVGPDGPVTVMSFRAEGPDLEVLHRVGHPFFRPGSGRGSVGMVLDGDTDWDEVAELVADSYCLMAPKKLAALVAPPAGG